MPESEALDHAFVRIEEIAKARELPGVERSTSYGTPSLKVGEIRFARMKDSQTLVLLCPDEQKALLMEISPEIYFETDHYVGHPAMLVRLDQISDEELGLRLEDAWRSVAGDQLTAQRPLSSSDE